MKVTRMTCRKPLDHRQNHKGQSKCLFAVHQLSRLQPVLLQSYVQAKLAMFSNEAVARSKAMNGKASSREVVDAFAASRSLIPLSDEEVAAVKPIQPLFDAFKIRPIKSNSANTQL